jgi:hypothetical protein
MCAAGLAGADQTDLTVRRVPQAAMPKTLAMRANAARADSEPQTERSLRKRAQDAFVRSFLDVPTDLEDLNERVVFHLDLGFGLDGGEPAGNAAALRGGDRPLQETEIDPDGFYERLRIYTFGDAVIGSRGLLMPSLSTYFASQFRFAQGGKPPTGAVPTIYDGSSSGDALLIRHGYAELHDVFDNRLLRPLFLRAGRQFRYGAAIAHFDGATIGYDTKTLSLGAFSGKRVSLYGLSRTDGAADSLITGSNIRINMYYLNGAPLVISGRFLNFDGAEHFQGGLGLRFSRDTLLRARLRSYRGSLVQEHANLRARLSKVTTLQIALDNRHARDWSYDLIVADADYSDGEDPRRFLSFGVPRARARLSVRAGTVLRDNLDLLVRGAIAREHSNDTASALHPSYAEAGLAFEMRFRRSLRVGSSVLARRYAREPATEMMPLDGVADALPATTATIGERSFYEGDLSFRYSLGSHQFDARADFYTRVYRGLNVLESRLDDDREFRSGARFSVQGWAGERLRMKGEYETAFAADFLSPEIRGPKSLRIVLEATF